MTFWLVMLALPLGVVGLAAALAARGGRKRS